MDIIILQGGYLFIGILVKLNLAAIGRLLNSLLGLASSSSRRRS